MEIAINILWGALGVLAFLGVIRWFREMDWTYIKLLIKWFR